MTAMTYYQGRMIPKSEYEAIKAGDVTPSHESQIPRQIQDCRMIVVKAGEKRATEKGWQTTANYRHDDPHLIAHLAGGGNYGVMPSAGIVIFDADNLQRLADLGVIEPLLSTYTVRTGRDNGGAHFYLHCPDLPAEKYILHDPEDGADLGDIRGSGHPSYVVGPGSLHPSGRRYAPVDPDAEILNVPADLLLGIIDRLQYRKKEANPASTPAPVSPPTPKTSNHTHASLTERLNLRVSDFLMPDCATPRGEEIEGVHPVHGSETGSNLTLSPDNTWWCRRHSTGGGALEALAVAERIIDCSEVRHGCLEGHWPELFRALEARGYGKRLADWKWERGKVEVPVSRPAPPAPAAQKNDPEPPQEPRQLPTIRTNGRHLNEVTADAVRALTEANDPPFLFRRGGYLVRVDRDERGRPEIRQVNEHALRGILDRVAVWVSMSKDKDGNWMQHPEIPPMPVVRDVLNLLGPSFPAPPLVGITHCPVLHPDGTIHATEGYDSYSRFYFAPEAGFVLGEVSEDPTSEEVQTAKAVLAEVFIDFPFVDEASRWNAVGEMVTVIVRPMIPGPCPCWLVDKPQAGSGASLMQGAVYTAATGVEFSATIAPKSGEEWEKRIFSILSSGCPIHVWDNLEGNFKSDALASVLTAPEWKGRILGRSEEMTLPARTVWMANGNNVQIGGDIGRRIFLSRIDPQMALPWQREGFRHPNLYQWILQNRGTIVAAVLTLARVWIRAGCPRPKNVPPVGGFEGWRDVVGGIMETVEIPEFMSNALTTYLDADVELKQWEGFVTTLHEVFESRPWTVADLRLRLKREADEESTYPTMILDTLPDPLAEAFADTRRSFARVCGRALAGQEGRRWPCGLMLKKGQTLHRATQWVVIACEKIEPDETHKTHMEVSEE